MSSRFAIAPACLLSASVAFALLLSACNGNASNNGFSESDQADLYYSPYALYNN